MKDAMSDQPSPPSTRKKMHALLLGDRIDTSGLERTDVLSTTPLAFRAGQEGVVTVFRYGVVVLFGMSLLEEDEVLRGLRTRIVRPVEPREDETATVEIAANKDEQILPGGPILLQAVTPEHMIVIADALAKSVVLARDEREVSSVIEVIEPFARQLAENGRTPEGGRAILKHVGNALLVQHRVSGRVAVAEKPDAVWDRPDLERLYARLQDEYELKERAEALSRKLALISETAKVLTDIIATKRSLRLELIIVLLIVFEIIITGYQNSAALTGSGTCAGAAPRIDRNGLLTTGIAMTRCRIRALNGCQTRRQAGVKDRPTPCARRFRKLQSGLL